MKKLLTTAMCTGLMLLGLHAFADDMTKPTDKQAHEQMMKDCMAKQEAKHDGSTKEQMKKHCKDEMQAQQGTMPKEENKY